MEKLTKIQLAAALVAAFGLAGHAPALAGENCEKECTKSKKSDTLKVSEKTNLDDKAKEGSCKSKEGSCKSKEGSCKAKKEKKEKSKEGSCKSKEGSCKAKDGDKAKEGSCKSKEEAK
ncbi:MAG: hypothetical protein K2W95_03640 [Candidatus Obscuribacterales bacterium]|nr:hypothetical protein [Candidatus Obscuribacterales bacterium]